MAEGRATPMRTARLLAILAAVLLALLCVRTARAAGGPPAADAGAARTASSDAGAARTPSNDAGTGSPAADTAPAAESPGANANADGGVPGPATAPAAEPIARLPPSAAEQAEVLPIA